MISANTQIHWKGCLVLANLALDSIHTNVKLEDHGQHGIGRSDIAQNFCFGVSIGQFANCHCIVMTKSLVVYFPQKFMHAWSIAIYVTSRLIEAMMVDNRRISEVAFAVHVDCIDSKSVNALFQPKEHCTVQNAFTCLVILPI